MTDAHIDIYASNGMAWSPDWSKMYYIDTLAQKIIPSTTLMNLLVPSLRRAPVILGKNPFTAS